jgi:hypothetical protein
MREKKLINIENTKFIFPTNFSGDPARDRFGSDARRATIIIPTEKQAFELMDMGVNVKQTKPRPGEEEDYVPVYYAPIRINYNTNWPPKIHLVSGNAMPVLLDEESVGAIDNCYVLNVNTVLNPSFNKNTGRTSLYVEVMYVEQEVERDPFAHRYIRGE